MKRLIQILWPLTVALLIIQAIYYYPLLPERLATHFDAAGHPNDWSSKNSFFILWQCIIVFLNAWVPLTGMLVRKLPPSMISVPNREYWMATPARREYLGEVVFIMMGGIFAGANVLLAVTMFQVVQFNLGRASRVGPTEIFIIVPLIIVFAIGCPLVMLQRKKGPDGALGSETKSAPRGGAF